MLLSYAYVCCHAFTCVVKINIMLLSDVIKGVRHHNVYVVCMAVPSYTCISMPVLLSDVIKGERRHNVYVARMAAPSYTCISMPVLLVMS